MTERNAEKANVGTGRFDGPQLNYADVMQQLGNGPGDRNTHLAGEVGGPKDHPWCGDPNTMLHYSQNQVINAYVNGGFEIVQDKAPANYSPLGHETARFSLAPFCTMVSCVFDFTQLRSEWLARVQQTWLSFSAAI